MEQIVRVKETFPDGSATVLLVRESACSGDCHKCSGCGAAKETMIFTAKNAIGAGPSDRPCGGHHTPAPWWSLS